jgi:hypothetical protein
MVADLGIDLAGVDDLTPDLAIVGGRRALIQSIARRLITPRGGLFYDPSYGFDLRQFLSGVTSAPSAIAAGVVAEAEKDARVEQATAVVTFTGDTLTVRLSIADGGGPFPLTLSVSKVTVTILSEG